MLINISGILTDENLMGAARTKVYLDLDPAFNQLWHAQGIDMHFGGPRPLRHGRPGDRHARPAPCRRRGIDWIPTVPPVVLEHWPCRGRRRRTSRPSATGAATARSSTTGVHYGQKAHSMRELLGLAARTDAPFRLALDIHPGETPDLEALDRNGWQIVRPGDGGGDPDSYRDFIAGSLAELGVAKSGYVLSRCGWFSDRSACYLASGKPVRRAGHRLRAGSCRPARGCWLRRPRTTRSPASRTCAPTTTRHARAARDIAEEHLDSRKVLARFLERVGSGAVSAWRSRAATP